MIGYNNLVKPYYAPRLSVEDVDQQQIIVLWVIAGNERPYEVPEIITSKHKRWKYFIRKYASSIEAKGTDKEELIALASNIPFDDRANTQATVSNISMVLVQDHLLNRHVGHSFLRNCRWIKEAATGRRQQKQACNRRQRAPSPLNQMGKHGHRNLRMGAQRYARRVGVAAMVSRVGERRKAERRVGFSDIAVTGGAVPDR